VEEFFYDKKYDKKIFFSKRPNILTFFIKKKYFQKNDKFLTFL